MNKFKSLKKGEVIAVPFYLNADISEAVGSVLEEEAKRMAKDTGAELKNITPTIELIYFKDKNNIERKILHATTRITKS